MKFTVNIEKRYAYFIVAVLVLMTSAFLVIGLAPADVSTHGTLYLE